PAQAPREAGAPGTALEESVNPDAPRHSGGDAHSATGFRNGMAAGLVLALAACASRPVSGPIPGSIQATPVEAPAEEEPDRIRSGDELEIRFFHTPERDVTMPVRPDGWISVPLAHELHAAGRTVEELRLELTERCSRELSKPEIT